MAADFFIGESLVGGGNEVAHIDLIIGSKSGPAGAAFTNALSNQKDGFTTLLAVVTPQLLVVSVDHTTTYRVGEAASGVRGRAHGPPRFRRSGAGSRLSRRRGRPPARRPPDGRSLLGRGARSGSRA